MLTVAYAINYAHRRECKMSETIYLLRHSEYNDIIECQSCHYPAPVAEFPAHRPGDPSRMLCEICASTYLGNITGTPHNYKTPSELAQFLGWFANHLLSEIRNTYKKGEQ